MHLYVLLALSMQMQCIISVDATLSCLLFMLPSVKKFAVKIGLFTERAKCVGLCVSAQTVKGLTKLVQQHGVQDKVIVLIGTNDILQAARSPSPVSNFPR